MGVQERREREREARRQAVLEAARELVREQGFNATTTKQIAARCELSEATLFWYFRSKDEILTSLLFEGIDFMARGVRRIVESGTPAEETLRGLWEFFAEVREVHPEYFHVFGYLAHPQSTAAVDEEVRAAIARSSGDNFRVLGAHFAGVLGEEHGRIAADLLWGAFVGLMVLRDSRVNLGAKAHPTRGDLEVAAGLLAHGLGRAAS